jgi:hypothetical protein
MFRNILIIKEIIEKGDVDESFISIKLEFLKKLFLEKRNIEYRKIIF